MTLLAHRPDDTGGRRGATAAGARRARAAADGSGGSTSTVASADAVGVVEAPRSGASAASGSEVVTTVHSPRHLARLIVLGGGFALLSLLTHLLPHTFVGLDVDAAAGPQLSSALTPFLTAYVLTVGAGFAVVAVGLTLVRGYPRYAVVIGASFVAATTLALVAFEALVTERPYDPSAPAMVAIAAGAVAVLVVVSDDLPRGLLRAGWWALVPPALLAGAWSGASIAAELLAVVGGGAVGAAIAFAVGTPSQAPSVSAVEAALAAAGLEVDEVEAHDVDARASVPWVARLRTGTPVFVKTHSADERSADLLFRAWRFLRLRRPGDERPEASLRRAVEHEAFVATRAGDIGVRTPRLVTLGRLGDDGMFAAYQVVDGRTFEEVGEDLPAATLRSVWSMAVAMHRAGIAHRDLRAANLLVDGDGEAWVVDFGFAELAATDRQQHLDVVELLASTATVVGTDAAVGAAVEVLGRDAAADALPLLQPAALSTATRKALGKDGIAELRRVLIEATGAPEPEEPTLERIRPKTVAMVAALGIAVWVLLPQVTQQGDLWSRVLDAQLGWVAVAVAASAATYIATTVGLLGAVPGDVPFGPTVVAQLASSFTNRITPANVGGMALNTRYLGRAGTGTTEAVTAVGVSATAGGAVHAVLIVFALAWAGTAGLGAVSLPEPRTLLVVAGLVLLVVAVGVVVPVSRRFLRQTVAGRARESASAVVDVARQPTKVVMLFGGSALVTVANLIALYAAIAAFGGTVPLSTVAVVYLAGSSIGAAAPTPSGLGALEAALVAGLVATGLDNGTAVAAVLLFRLATFWLPILPGWASFVWLERTGRV